MFTAEDTEFGKKKSGEFVALDRKSPPLENKGGAPSSSLERRRDWGNPRAQSCATGRRLFFGLGGLGLGHLGGQGLVDFEVGHF